MVRVAKHETDADADAAADAHAVCVRVSTAYRHYLLRLAASERLTLSSLVDRAVETYARSVKFPEMPPQR